MTIGTGTSTDTGTDTDERLSEGDDVVFHYVDKAKIVESAVMGDLVTALCGATFPVTRQPKPGAAVCGTCRELMEMLRSFGG